MNGLEFFGYLFVYGAILTYLVLGFIVSFESILVLYEVPAAVRWIREWHSPAGYRRMLMLFFPMLQLAYLFLELIPHLLGLSDERRPFDPDRIWWAAFGEDG
jgi:hypothetical protein